MPQTKWWVRDRAAVVTKAPTTKADADEAIAAVRESTSDAKTTAKVKVKDG